jgi:hypothetical protein
MLVMRSTVRQVAFGAAIACALSASAMAAPINFTWTPTGATPSLNGGPIVNANNYNVADFASIAVNNGTGTFTETGALNVLNFLNGGSTVPSPGLGSTYSLYLTFSAAGTSGGIPTVNGTSTNGAFTSLDYQLIGTTAGSPPVAFTVGNGSVTTTDPGSNAVLAYGSLVPGTGFVTLTKTANGFSPTANLNLTFNECLAAGQGGICTANESTFFTSPVAGLNLQVGNFSANDQVTTVNTVDGTTFVNLTGGAGNLTFQQTPTPEPASMALLGAGLVGLGLIRRRR